MEQINCNPKDKFECTRCDKQWSSWCHYSATYKQNVIEVKCDIGGIKVFANDDNGYLLSESK